MQRRWQKHTCSNFASQVRTTDHTSRPTLLETNWVESTKEDWEGKVRELIIRDEWIMDGNYGGTLDLRTPRADTIIFLDVSTWTCLYRVTRRILKYFGKVRPDMTEDCVERFDLEFFHYVLMYNITRRKSLIKKLKDFGKDKNVYILKSSDELDKVLNQKSAERFNSQH